MLKTAISRQSVICTSIREFSDFQAHKKAANVSLCKFTRSDPSSTQCRSLSGTVRRVGRSRPPGSVHGEAGQGEGPGPDLLEGELEKGNAPTSHLFKKYTSWRSSNNRTNGGVIKGNRSNRRLLRFTQDVEIQGEVLYGTFPVLLALRAGRRRTHALHIKHSLLEAGTNSPYISQILSLAGEQGIAVVATDTPTLDNLSGGRPHQGVCLDVDHLNLQRFQRASKSPPLEAADTIDKSPQLWVVLESIYDPMNFGAILRSCYFLGVDGVITVKDRSCPPTPVVSKASAGVMELAPIWIVSSVVDFIQAKKDEGWHIVGAVGASDNPDPRTVPLWKTHLDKDTVLLIGNEGSGLTPEAADLCHILVTVIAGRQLAPGVESLNVSVATGIILHHFSHRQ